MYTGEKLAPLASSIDVRTNQFGDPMLNIHSAIQGSTGFTTHLLWQRTLAV
jgi:hypothetical protein